MYTYRSNALLRSRNVYILYVDFRRCSDRAAHMHTYIYSDALLRARNVYILYVQLTRCLDRAARLLRYVYSDASLRSRHVYILYLHLTRCSVRAACLLKYVYSDALLRPRNVYILYTRCSDRATHLIIRRRSDLKELRLPEFQQSFMGVPVNFKQVFTGGP